MEIEKETRESIWKVERSIHNGASLGNTRPGQRNESRSKYVRLYNREGVVNKV